MDSRITDQATPEQLVEPSLKQENYLPALGTREMLDRNCVHWRSLPRFCWRTNGENVRMLWPGRSELLWQIDPRFEFLDQAFR